MSRIEIQKLDIKKASDNTVTATVTLKEIGKTSASAPEIPWKKYRTVDVQELLLSEGHEVEACVQESAPISTATSNRTGTWVFSLQGRQKTPETTPAPRRKRQPTPKSKKTE